MLYLRAGAIPQGAAHGAKPGRADARPEVALAVDNMTFEKLPGRAHARLFLSIASVIVDVTRVERCDM